MGAALDCTCDVSLGRVSANAGVTVLPRSVVETSRVQDALRCEAFVPQPLWIDTLLVRRKDTYVGATMHAFDTMVDTVERG